MFPDDDDPPTSVGEGLKGVVDLHKECRSHWIYGGQKKQVEAILGFVRTHPILAWGQIFYRLRR